MPESLERTSPRRGGRHPVPASRAPRSALSGGFRLGRALSPRLALLVGLLCLWVLGCGGTDPLLLPDPATTSGTTGSVTGTITSSGVPQASVNLRTVPTGATTATQGDGTYTLAGVSPGRVTVVAEKSGFLRRFQQVTVVAGRTARADLELLPATGAGSIQGAITDGSLALEDVEVVTTPATQTQITTADGRYLVTGAPGAYEVTARRVGYASQSRVVQVLEGQTVSQDFSMGPRNDGIVSGIVADRLGNTLQNARVDLFFGSEVFTAFTDSTGAFAFVNLTTGFYVLSTEADGFLPGSKGLDVAGGALGNGDVIMALSSTIPPVPGAITGTIYDRQGNTQSGITVQLSVTASPSSVLTAADGRFTFVDVPAGPVTVSASQTTVPSGGDVLANGSRSISVGAGQTADGSMFLEAI